MGGAADMRRPAPCGPHCGTANGYNHHGCRCLSGYDAVARWDRERRAAIREGTWRPWVGAGRSIRHLATLTGLGMTYEMIGVQTFMHPDHLHQIAAGMYRKLRPATEEMITGTGFAMAAPTPLSYVPAVGTARRLQGLRAVGWSCRSLEDMGGECLYRVSQAAKRTWVQQRTYLMVVDLCERLQGLDPVAYGVYPAWYRKNIAEGVTRGWVPLSAWEQPIDDPRSEPYKAPVSRRVDRGRAGARRSEIVEETAHLASYGCGPHDIAERLGVEWSSVLVAHQRAGVPVPGRLVA